MGTLGVVVLSGGLDSATALAVAVKNHGRGNVHTLSFEYGQKHKIELDCAKALSGYYQVRYNEVLLPESLFKGGVLTTSDEVPEMKYADLPDGVRSPTYVPFRNGNLLAQAAAYADTKLISSHWDNVLIYAGMHAEDAAGFAYADCTPEFLGAMASAIYIGTYGSVRLNALFQHMTKPEIIHLGMDLMVPYEMTHSCYRGTRPACGVCSTCQARKEAFDVAGYDDPIEYVEAT